MNSESFHTFQTIKQLEKWLQVNHSTQSELWVRIYKKGSGTTSVNWDDCVIAAISWGWIDGIRKSLDDVSFLQRLTPRRSKSNWSKKNSEHAERLITEGRMQPAGLLHVESAKQDGRWERAYAGSADMVIPDDFLKVLRKNLVAKRFFATLDRRNLYAIYHRLHTAKRVETREKRILEIVEKLGRQEKFH